MRLARPNGQAPVHGCVAGSGNNDTIVFAAGVTGTITLSFTPGVLPAIVGGETLTITGPTASPGITISGGGAVQLMIVKLGATLNLQFLTLENGSVSGTPVQGGGIVNNGTLTVTNCTFSGNQAVGNNGENGEGGGIFNSGTLTVSSSTLSDNHAIGGSGSVEGGAGGGGAIFIDTGTLTITNSTFSANQATGGASSSAGAAGSGAGGAVFDSVNVTVTNSTFSGNQTTAGLGGAIFNDSGTVSLKGTILGGQHRQ